MNEPKMAQRLAAEFLGTFWLVFGGAGSAVFAAVYLTPNNTAGQSFQLGIGFLGVALAFGPMWSSVALARPGSWSARGRPAPQPTLEPVARRSISTWPCPTTSTTPWAICPA